MLKSIKEEIAKSKFKKLFEEIALDLSSTAVDLKEAIKVKEKYLRDLYPIYKSCYPNAESIEDILEDELGYKDTKPEFEKQLDELIELSSENFDSEYVISWRRQLVAFETVLKYLEHDCSDFILSDLASEYLPIWNSGLEKYWIGNMGGYEVLYYVRDWFDKRTRTIRFLKLPSLIDQAWAIEEKKDFKRVDKALDIRKYTKNMGDDDY